MNSLMFQLVAIPICLVVTTADGFQSPGIEADEQKKYSTKQIRAVEVTTVADNVDVAAAGLAVDRAGNLFIADLNRHWHGKKIEGGENRSGKILKMSPNGNITTFIDGLPGILSGLAFDSDGNLFVAGYDKRGFVTKLSAEGTVLGSSNKRFHEVLGIAIDRDNQIYICSSKANRFNAIQRYSPSGKSNTICKSKLLNNPIGIACDTDQTLYVSNSSGSEILKITSDGEATVLAKLPPIRDHKNQFGGTVAMPRMNRPCHLVLFKENLYVAGYSANRVYKVTLGGAVSVFAGSGERGNTDGSAATCSFSSPIGIAISPEGRFMYVSEAMPIEGDKNIIHPTRIRRIEIGRDK